MKIPEKVFLEYRKWEVQAVPKDPKNYSPWVSRKVTGLKAVEMAKNLEEMMKGKENETMQKIIKQMYAHGFYTEYLVEENPRRKTFLIELAYHYSKDLEWKYGEKIEREYRKREKPKFYPHEPLEVTSKKRKSRYTEKLERNIENGMKKARKMIKKGKYAEAKEIVEKLKLQALWYWYNMNDDYALVILHNSGKEIEKEIKNAIKNGKIAEKIAEDLWL